MLVRIPFGADPVFKAIFLLILCVVIGAGVLAAKLTKGYIAGYLSKDIPPRLKMTMLIFQGLGSLILALIGPNNYLVRITFFRDLYAQSGLWIPLSMLMLLFISVLVIGSLFSFLTRNMEVKDDFLR
jgi:hypothetical protein